MKLLFCDIASFYSWQSHEYFLHEYFHDQTWNLGIQFSQKLLLLKISFFFQVKVDSKVVGRVQLLE